MRLTQCGLFFFSFFFCLAGRLYTHFLQLLAESTSFTCWLKIIIITIFFTFTRGKVSLDADWSKRGKQRLWNLLIDKIFLNGTRRYTLPKAELMLQLSGLEEILEIHGIHFSLINLIKSVMKTWRITLEVKPSEGKETFSTIKVNRGIFQGDSFVLDHLSLYWIP